MKTYKKLTCQKCNATVTIRGIRETEPEPTECGECGTPYIWQKPIADPDANVQIKLHYRDGEYLTGHTVHGNEAKLLEKIGLARYVDGWGYLVDYKTVNALGTEFLYQQALDFARPTMETKQARKDAEATRIASIFAEAAHTGKPIILEQYTAECNLEDCSQDNVTVYAMPDGKTRSTRSHTY